MNISVDTNVLMRAIVGDDAKQSRHAQAELAKAEVLTVATPALCELVWVLAQGYKIAVADIVETIRRLLASENVVANRPAVEAGLAMMDAGGDFADGVIAFEGRLRGADIFVSFDSKAVKILKAHREAARLLPSQ